MVNPRKISAPGSRDHGRPPPPFTLLPTYVVTARGRPEGFTAGHLRVYGMIAAHADRRTHQAWCGDPRLARLLGITRETVKEFRRDLKDWKLLDVTARFASDGRQQISNLYTLRWPADPGWDETSLVSTAAWVTPADHPRLTMTALGVYVLQGARATRKTRTAWWGEDLLAREIGRSTRRISSALSLLERRDLIRHLPPSYRAGGGRARDAYQVAPWPEDLPEWYVDDLIGPAGTPTLHPEDDPR